MGFMTGAIGSWGPSTSQQRSKEQENQASAQDDAHFSLLCDRLTAYLLRQTAWEFRDRRFFVRECLWNAMILELSGPTSWT